MHGVHAVMIVFLLKSHSLKYCVWTRVLVPPSNADEVCSLPHPRFVPEPVPKLHARQVRHLNMRAEHVVAISS